MAERCLCLFEQLGDIYTEVDGILYPNLRLGDSDSKKPIFKGRYGGIWMVYMEEIHPDRYNYLLK